MKSFKQFLMEEEITYAGFNLRQPTKQENEFLSKNPHVAGYYGTGDAGDKSQEGTIVISPHNEYMKDSNKRGGLAALEAVRGIHAISPTTLQLAPDLTKEQEENFDFYTQGGAGEGLTDQQKKDARKSTFYSRLTVGDDLNPMGGKDAKQPTITPEQEQHRAELNQAISDKGWYGKHKAQSAEAIPSNLA